MKVNAGKYRHFINIHHPSTTRDTSGARTGLGALLDDVWAAKEDWTGVETREDGKETSVITTKFFIRYRTDILPKMLIVHGSSQYDIENVMDFDGMKRELTLMCRRVL